MNFLVLSTEHFRNSSWSRKNSSFYNKEALTELSRIIESFPEIRVILLDGEIEEEISSLFKIPEKQLEYAPANMDGNSLKSFSDWLDLSKEFQTPIKSLFIINNREMKGFDYFVCSSQKDVKESIDKAISFFQGVNHD